jgi:hypothetical protein
LVQLGNEVYAGTYQDTTSTSLFFSQQDNPLDEDSTTAPDPVFGRHVSKRVEYLDSTRKKLKLKRVFLKSKAPSTAAAVVPSSSPDVSASCSNQNYSYSDVNQVNLTKT